MIDWLTLVAPLPHPAAISSGLVLSMGPDGVIDWQTAKRLSLPGSWSTTIQVRTATHTEFPCTHLEVSGNPVKWFQGHNLWGTDDLPGLVVAMLDQIAQFLRLPVHCSTRDLWYRGDITLTRVDVTQSFQLSSLAEVLAWLRAAEQTAHLSHRGRGQLVKGSTLYFGKSSRRWSLKLYAKGQEIRAKGHGQDAILDLPHAQAWAEKALRAELTLRSLELKRLGLNTVSSWHTVDTVDGAYTVDTDSCSERYSVHTSPATLVREKLGGLTMTSAATLPPETLDQLTSAQLHAYHAWAAGTDLRSTMSRPSFYRLRAKLLPHGIDIATVMPKEVSNVVPLYRVLEAVPVGVPTWAQGTPLYFEPRRIA